MVQARYTVSMTTYNDNNNKYIDHLKVVKLSSIVTVDTVAVFLDKKHRGFFPRLNF